MFLTLTGLGLAGGYGFGLEPGWLRLKSYTINTPKWPEGAKPLKIAYASDLHAGCPSMGAAQMAAVVARINALSADIICLGGDFLTSGVLFGRYVPPGDITPILAGLRAPLGVFAVLGNHDWRKDGEGMRRALEGASIHVLENEHRMVERDGQKIAVAGMADDSTRTPDYAASVAGIPWDVPVIMLAHDPASFLDIDDRPALTLCGHTHGGQVTIPYISPIVIPGRAPLKYAYGHIHEQGRDMIVSSGLGTTTLPVRFGRRPEILSVTVAPDTGQQN